MTISRISLVLGIVTSFALPGAALARTAYDYGVPGKSYFLLGRSITLPLEWTKVRSASGTLMTFTMTDEKGEHTFRIQDMKDYRNCAVGKIQERLTNVFHMTDVLQAVTTAPTRGYSGRAFRWFEPVGAGQEIHWCVQPTKKVGIPNIVASETDVITRHFVENKLIQQFFKNVRRRGR